MLYELDPKEKNGTLYILMKNISRKVQFETDFDCADTFLYISIGLPWEKGNARASTHMIILII